MFFLEKAGIIRVMSHVDPKIPKSAFFEATCESVSCVAFSSAIVVTALVISILGTYSPYIPYHGAWVPTLYTSIGLLIPLVAYIIALIKNSRQTVQELSLGSHVVPDIRYDPPEKPLDATQFGLKCLAGRKFPQLPAETKQKAVNETVAGLEKMKGEKIPQAFAPYLWALKYIVATELPSNQGAKGRFFPLRDVLQTPILLNRNEFFEPIESKNYFFMHSSVAPKWTDYKGDKEQYLQDMEEGYYLTIKAQLLSKAQHLFSNYWGMGAFIRHAYQGSKMIEFRQEVAKRLVKAYCRAFDGVKGERAEPFTFYLGGPTGVSLPSEFEAEPRENYNAFVLAFSECDSKYTKNVVLCPETDIFVKAQEISDTYVCKEGEMAPVSALNASDSRRLGNHWYVFKREGKKPNAEFAIEENVFRRSLISAWIAEKLNYQENPSAPVSLWANSSDFSRASSP